MYTIIPGLRIEIKEYGSQLMDNGEEGHKIDEAYIYYRGLCCECIKEELEKQKN